MNQFRLNLNHSPPDRRDYKVKIKSAKPLKHNMVDLSSYCTSVKNQGSIGSCTAFAVVGLMEYIHKRALNNGEEDIYSEKFTYYDTRVNQLGWPATEDSGAYLRNAMASVVQAGAAPESKFPYNSSFSEIPSREVFDSAEKNQVISYANIPDGTDDISRQECLNSCKQILQEGHPIVGGFVCYDSLWSAENGVIPGPGGTIIGGHAILIIGYDDANNRFKFKNSWSTQWGENGYGYLPYEYLLKGDLWDLWTVFSQENFDNNDIIDIEKPEPEEDSKQERDELIKKWSSIINDVQDLKLLVDKNANLDQYVKECASAIQEAQIKLHTLQRQMNNHRQIIVERVALIQDKVFTAYEAISKT